MRLIPAVPSIQPCILQNAGEGFRDTRRLRRLTFRRRILPTHGVVTSQKVRYYVKGEKLGKG